MFHSFLLGYKDEPWEYFWLENGGICALCGTETMWTFVITPIVSLVVTIIFTGLDLAIRGESARTNSVQYFAKKFNLEKREMGKLEEVEPEKA